MNSFTSGNINTKPRYLGRTALGVKVRGVSSILPSMKGGKKIDVFTMMLGKLV